jgi:glycosyltransferase involved in cell wall biosynthesis
MRARKRWGSFDVIHINDITMPFPAWLAKRLFPRSVVLVHARSVLRTVENWRKQWLRHHYLKSADAVVAIDDHVGESLPAGLPVHVIHNGMIVPAGVDQCREKSDGTFTVAMVGMLARVKGCADFVEAAAICRDRGYNIRFVLIGGGIRKLTGWRNQVLQWLGFKEDIGDEVKMLSDRLGLEGVVVFRPATTDLASIYRAIDILCFPSHFDAPGRPIFEAGFFGVPSIAAISQPKADTFLSGETGLLVQPGAPDALAEAIIRLHDNPEDRLRMGNAARRMSYERFDAQKNARKVLRLYQHLCRESTSRRFVK